MICNTDYCRGSQILSAEVQIWSGKVPVSYQQDFDIKGLEIRGVVRNVTSQDVLFIVGVEIPIISCWELFLGSYFNPVILPVPRLRWWQWNN